MIDALEFLSHAHPELGIAGAPNFSRKMPVRLKMNRAHLAMLLEALGCRAGAEVGVYKGVHAKLLWEKNPEATLYCVDPWKAYPEYYERCTQEQMDGYRAEAERVLAGTGCVIVPEFSMEAVNRFDDGELDFVYIDGNHEFQHVTNDIAEWSKKVRVGGIVAGHDYVRYKRRPFACHVKSVVAAWAYSHKIRPWFVANGQKYAEWFWVNDIYEPMYP